MGDADSNKLVAQLEELGVQDDAVFDKKDWMEQQEPHIRSSLESLDKNQGDIDALLKSQIKERRELDMKYQRLLEPHYAGRKEIVKGDCAAADGGTAESGVPGFWLRVLQSHSELEERINPTDAAILEHLVDVSGSRFCTETDGERSYGYTVAFSFVPNTYFSETALSVTAVFSDEEETIIKGIEGCVIPWSSSGCNPTVKIMKKKGSGGGQKLKMAPVDSFFKLFQPVQPPTDGTIGLNEYEEMKEDAEDCLAILTLLMEELIPNAFKYFSGEKTFDIDIEEESELSDTDDHGEADDQEEADDHVQGHHGRILQGEIDGNKQDQQDCKQQ